MPTALAADPRLRILSEGALPIPAAFEQVTGRTVCVKTALRYAIAGRGGIRLESLKVAGKRLTSTAAVQRFLIATQPQPAAPAAATIDAVAADQVLASFGLPREV